MDDGGCHGGHGYLEVVGVCDCVRGVFWLSRYIICCTQQALTLSARMVAKYFKTSQGLLFLKLVSLLALIVGIYVLTESSMPSFSISSTGRVHHSTTTCQERIDELDRIFNQRRNARIELIADINKDDTPSYDLYEPEAVCFSEERFGSEKRYTAFSDGTFFLVEI